MNIRKYILLTGLSLAVVFSSCQDEYEKMPVEDFTLDFVFSRTDSLGVQAKKYLNAVYSHMRNGHNRVWGDYLDAATDDAITSAITENDVDRLLMGNYSAASILGAEMNWGPYYSGIRKANTFIANIDVVPLKDKYKSLPLNEVWKSEARFIRAFHYFELLKRFGGIPLMGDEPLQLDDNLEIPRNTFEECVNYIVSELDAIKDSLREHPLDNPQANAHVPTKGAAMALKARVLLYAASPLFNGGNIDPDNPLTGYLNYDAERWKKAADAAREFIEDNPYYQLHSEFDQVFTQENREVIFHRQGGNNTSIENTNGPVGYTGSNIGNGRTSPSQNLVEAFPMLDGKPINDPSSVYTYAPNDPYKNRDPRLAKTVMFNGKNWLGVQLELFQGGKHNPNGSVQKTKTGYYLRKFMGAFENEANYSSKKHDWIVLRYADILLNYAEALNEYAGPSNEVYQALIAIRERAGIEAGLDGLYGLKPNMTKSEMREAIRLERRLELAFEEHRYWDLKRWKIAEEIYKQPINGLVIIKSGGAMNYNVTPVFHPVFKERQYLYPIPYDEVIKNDEMVQNPGWE